MTAVSELFPAGGGNNTIEMVASGALANGDKVVLQSDGTVKVVTGSTTSLSQDYGSETTYESRGYTDWSYAVFDSNSNKVVVAWRYSSTGYVAVGTVSGTSISFGSRVTFQSSVGSLTNITAVFDSNSNKIVIAYDKSTGGTAIVGTVSGTSISFGSAVNFITAGNNITNSDHPLYMSSTFDSNSNKVVLAYRNNSHYAGYAMASVGTVSGTSISFGPTVVFNSGSTYDTGTTFDSDSNKVVIAYSDSSAGKGNSVVGTVSGTSISFGSEVTFNSTGDVDFCRPVFEPNTNKVVIAYRHNAAGKAGKMLIGTVSGTSISYGSSTTFNSSATHNNKMIFDSQSNKFVNFYRDAGNSSYGTAVVATISGSTMSYGTPVVLHSGYTDSSDIAFDSNSNKVVMVYRAAGNSSYGTAIVWQNATTINNTNLTDNNLLGIAQAAVADTEIVEVETLGGLATNLSGLTIGSKYYVQDDGTTTTNSAGQFLGRAVTATTINMKDFA